MYVLARINGNKSRFDRAPFADDSFTYNYVTQHDMRMPPTEHLPTMEMLLKNEALLQADEAIIEKRLGIKQDVARSKLRTARR